MLSNDLSLSPNIASALPNATSVAQTFSLLTLDNGNTVRVHGDTVPNGAPILLRIEHSQSGKAPSAIVDRHVIRFDYNHPATAADPAAATSVYLTVVKPRVSASTEQTVRNMIGTIDALLRIDSTTVTRILGGQS